jgi:hypothetical protein
MSCRGDRLIGTCCRAMWMKKEWGRKFPTGSEIRKIHGKMTKTTEVVMASLRSGAGAGVTASSWRRRRHQASLLELAPS